MMPSDSTVLREGLLRGLSGSGTDYLTSEQQQAVEAVARGSDVALCLYAESAVALAVLQRVDFEQPGVQALVLQPTCELAERAAAFVASLGAPISNGRDFCTVVTPARGGTEAAVAVGTPCSVLHLLQGGALQLSGLRLLCVGGVDAMLPQESEQMIHDIAQQVPECAQVMLAAQGAHAAARRLSRDLMRDPVHITTSLRPLSVVRHFHVEVNREKWKAEVLEDLLYTCSAVPQTVVFFNTPEKAEWLARKIEKPIGEWTLEIPNRLKVSQYHERMTQAERDEACNAFRIGTSRLLFATAMPEDMTFASMVVCYDVPCDHDTYLQRAEIHTRRTSRARQRGFIVTFFTDEELHVVRDLEAFYDITLEELPMNYADIFD